MSELDNHIAEISSAVWHFVDEIAGGKVADELLDMHGISEVAASHCSWLDMKAIFSITASCMGMIHAKHL